jgi:hypothetical protein
MCDLTTPTTLPKRSNRAPPEFPGAVHAFALIMRTQSSARVYLGFPFALRLMRKLLKKQGFSPKLLITDKLRSHASALWRLGLSCPY